MNTLKKMPNYPDTFRAAGQTLKRVIRFKIEVGEIALVPVPIRNCEVQRQADANVLERRAQVKFFSDAADACTEKS